MDIRRASRRKEGRGLAEIAQGGREVYLTSESCKKPTLCYNHCTNKALFDDRALKILSKLLYFVGDMP